MSRKLLKKWLPSQAQAAKHKALQAFGEALKRKDIWSLTRYSVAKACAIGMFIGILPLMPFQMLLSGTLAILFRANIFIAVSLIWITNPITAPPIYYFCYKLGMLVLAPAGSDYALQWSLSGLYHELGRIWRPLFVGSFICAVIASVISYYGVLLTWRIAVSRQWALRKQRPRKKNRKKSS